MKWVANLKTLIALTLVSTILVTLVSSEYAEIIVAEGADILGADILGADILGFDEDEDAGSCGNDRFECRNGECIGRDLLCDGTPDCSDQSDETRLECTRSAFSCPNQHFRCDYGACVSKGAICDGVKDCLDNSDELLDECPRASSRGPYDTVFLQLYDNDGRVPEITPIRRRIYRLKIPRLSQGISTDRLYRLRPSGPSRPSKTLALSTSLDPLTSRRRPASLLSSESPIALYSFCVVPPQPSNGQWKLHRRFCKGNEHCNIAQGIALEFGSQLVYTCAENFMPNGNTDVYCRAGGKWSVIPVCIVSSCEPLNSISRAAECSRFGERVSCESPLLPYTRARVTCRINYGLASSFSTGFEQNVECGTDGRWFPEPIACSPVCGLVQDRDDERPPVNGIPGAVEAFPWHANIWKKVDTRRGPRLEFQCSATIVNDNFVITAAHCVVDKLTGRSASPERLGVTAGNIQRVPWIVQKVKNVYIYCEYFGLIHGYGSDIALVELYEPFELSAALLPACLDISSSSDQSFQPGVTGRIDGFGRLSASLPSPVLQTAKVTYVPNRECKMPFIPSRGKPVIGNDEFCGQYSNETTICDWDSGGGFVVQKGGLWHLMGVFITDLTGSATTCGDNPYSLYTKVPPYMSWIQDVMFQLERYKSYPLCSLDLPPLPPPIVTTQPITPPWWTTPAPTSVTSADVGLSTTTTATPTTTQSPVDFRTFQNGTGFACLVPPQPANGEWKLHQDLCNNTDCDAPAGARLLPGSQLVYSCVNGFRLKGNSDVYCGTRGQWSTIPTCVEIRCTTLESASRTVTCYRSNIWVPCNSTSLPNTRAVITCRVGYREDASSLKAERKTVECGQDGEWDPKPITCVPVCGETNSRLTPTIINGTAADITEFPWHASLYKQDNVTQGSKEFICGATIIQNNLLLTAAHCVYDDRYKVVEIPEKFDVVAGNKFRDYDSPLHDPRVVQKSSVKNIYVPCEYYGLEGNYASDIAIIELREPFQLSNILSPACLDVLGNNEQILEPGAVGKFAGFGRTSTGRSSGTLLTTQIPYVGYKQCRMTQNGDASNLALIGQDKFCGGGNKGMAVCEGDSGGGLTFNNGEKSYVLGILSVNLGADTSTGEKTCDANSYSLYTKVTNHMAWIRNVMFHLEREMTYASCGSA